MASVQDIKAELIAEVILTLFLTYNEFDVAKMETLWLLCWGTHLMRESFIFSVLDGWIARCFFAYIAL